MTVKTRVGKRALEFAMLKVREAEEHRDICEADLEEADQDLQDAQLFYNRLKDEWDRKKAASKKRQSNHREGK